jgi:hypothetical protein
MKSDLLQKKGSEAGQFWSQAKVELMREEAGNCPNYQKKL